MMNAERCPTSGVRIDETAARINGMIVTVLVLAAMAALWAGWVAQARMILAYLAADFSLKVFVGFPASPNCRFARLVARTLGLPKRPIDAAPKRFAATIGFAMSVVALGVSYVAGAQGVVLGMLGVFLVCAALEGLLGVCVGCMLYGLMPARVARVFVERIR